jgi:hypothetical protein
MDDVASAVAKVYEHREALAENKAQAVGAGR